MANADRDLKEVLEDYVNATATAMTARLFAVLIENGWLGHGHDCVLRDVYDPQENVRRQRECTCGYAGFMYEQWAKAFLATIRTGRDPGPRIEVDSPFRS